MVTLRYRFAASQALIAIVGGTGVLLALAIDAEVSQYVAPTVASIALFGLFALALQRQLGGNIFGELGFLYLGLTVAYTVLPAFAFIVTGLTEGGPLALLLPDPAELSKHLWRHVLFQAGVSGGYLLLRGRVAVSSPIAAASRERDGRALLFVAALLAASMAAVIVMSAPVESYYDHYTRYDHLPWLQRKFVSVAIRLTLGLYCVLLVFLFRNYSKYKLLIPLVVVAIVSHEMVYSFGARIQALIVLLQAVCLYHYTVRRISLKWGLFAVGGMGVLFSAVELYRVTGFDLSSTADVFSEEGLKPAAEFVAVFFSGFHLYAERAQGSLPPREWPMFFNDFISLFTFGDFTRWNPMVWYARNYYPQWDVPPFTMGPIADSAIWGGELDLLVRSVLNGVFFAYIMRWFLRFKERWWGLSVYVYSYATCILTLKYSVFLLLNPIVKNVVPTLLLVHGARVLRLRMTAMPTRELEDAGEVRPAPGLARP